MHFAFDGLHGHSDCKFWIRNYLELKMTLDKFTQIMLKSYHCLGVCVYIYLFLWKVK